MLATELLPILIAVLGTIAGSISSCMYSKTVNKSNVGVLIATAAGMMVGCSLVLIGESVERSGLIRGLAAVAVGMMLMVVLDYLFTNCLDVDTFHFTGLSGQQAMRVALMIVGLVGHSVGEGLSLGMSAAESSSTSTIVSTSLAIHNIPETAALMFSFRAKGLSDGLSAVLAILSNLPQSIVALPAFSLFSSSALLMQWGMGMAAGCMMYSVSTDIYPEAVTAIGSPRARTVASLAGSLVVAFDIYSHIHIR